MIGISWGGFNGLQVAAPSPARAEGGGLHLLHRRSLRGRHPLHGRVPAQRHPGLERLHVLDQHDPARSGGGRRQPVEGGLDREAAGQRPVAGGLADPPAARRFLQARLGMRELLRHRGRGLRCRRLGRRVLERGLPAAGRSPVSLQGARRTLGPQVPALRRARPRDRVPAGVPALVGPLAEGRGHRNHGRAEAALLDRGPGAPAYPLQGTPGAVGGGGVMAVAAHRIAGAAPRPGCARRCAGCTGADDHQLPGDSRNDGGAVVPARPRPRPAGRSAPGGGVARWSSIPMRWKSLSMSSVRRSCRWSWPATSRWRWWPPACPRCCPTVRSRG